MSPAGGNHHISALGSFIKAFDFTGAYQTRTPSIQGGFQAAGIVVSLLMAFAGGAIVGKAEGSAERGGSSQPGTAPSTVPGLFGEPRQHIPQPLPTALPSARRGHPEAAHLGGRGGRELLRGRRLLGGEGRGVGGTRWRCGPAAGPGLRGLCRRCPRTRRAMCTTCTAPTNPPRPEPRLPVTISALPCSAACVTSCRGWNKVLFFFPGLCCRVSEGWHVAQSQLPRVSRRWDTPGALGTKWRQYRLGVLDDVLDNAVWGDI